MVSVRGHYGEVKEWFKNSEQVEVGFELCNTYAVPLLLFNIIIYGLLTNIEFGVLLMGVVLIHEGAHYLTMTYHGVRPNLYVFPVLGAAVDEPYKEDEALELTTVQKRDVYLAGPVASVLVNSILLSIFALSGGQSYILLSFISIMALNDLFNALPIWKLDGGRTKEMFFDMVHENKVKDSFLTLVVHAAVIGGDIAILGILLIQYNLSPIGLMRGVV